MTYLSNNQMVVQEAKLAFYSNCNPGALSLRDLLLLILEPIVSKRSISELSDLILEKGIREIAQMSEYELSLYLGLNEKQSFHLMSVFEIAKRMSQIQNSVEKTVIRNVGDAVDLLMDLQHLEKEHFVVLYLDTKLKVIGRETISIGSLNAAIVHPREVFRQAIRRGACSILGAHNHPSGDPTPSPEDIDITKRLKETGDIVGIEFLDHVIIGGGKYRSLKEDGYLLNTPDA